MSWDYGGVGRASAVYWSSLTLLDPIAATLLFVRPRTGIMMSIAVIVTNVIHNLAITARYAQDGGFVNTILSSAMLLSQIGFMILVVVTTHIAWRGVAEHRPASTRQA